MPIFSNRRGLKSCQLDSRGIKLSLRGAKCNLKILRGMTIFIERVRDTKKSGRNPKLTLTGYPFFEMTNPLPFVHHFLMCDSPHSHKWRNTSNGTWHNGTFNTIMIIRGLTQSAYVISPLENAVGVQPPQHVKGWGGTPLMGLGISEVIVCSDSFDNCRNPLIEIRKRAFWWGKGEGCRQPKNVYDYDWSPQKKDSNDC